MLVSEGDQPASFKFTYDRGSIGGGAVGVEWGQWPQQVFTSKFNREKQNKVLKIKGRAGGGGVV